MNKEEKIHAVIDSLFGGRGKLLDADDEGCFWVRGYDETDAELMERKERIKPHLEGRNFKMKP